MRQTKRERDATEARAFLESAGMTNTTWHVPAGLAMVHIERFWAKVVLSADGHWWWTGAGLPNGIGLAYGTTAHRFAWALVNGPPPPGCNIVRTCGTPQCVRLDHLVSIAAGGDRQQAGKLGGRGKVRPRRSVKGASVAVGPRMVDLLRTAHGQGVPLRQLCEVSGLGPDAVLRIIGSDSDPQRPG